MFRLNIWNPISKKNCFANNQHLGVEKDFKMEKNPKVKLF
jgi:hypothetical protein